MRHDTIRWAVARALLVPSYCWNRLLSHLRIRNWWDRVDEHLIVGALPRASHVGALQAEGVTAVVNTCEEYAGPRAAYAKAGIEQLRIPTVDFTHPELQDVERAVAFIDRHVAQGGTVYVHCKAGRARSATVALCWLIAAKNLSAGEGQRLLLERRHQISPRLTEREVVQQFARRRRPK